MLITSLIAKIINVDENLKNTSQNIIDTTKQASDASNNIQNLIDQYSQLAKSGKTDSDTKQQLLSIQSQLDDAFGVEAGSIDLANGKYQDQIKILNQLAAQKAKDDQNDAQARLNEANKNLKASATEVTFSSVYSTNTQETSALKGLSGDTSMQGGSVIQGAEGLLHVTGDLSKRYQEVKNAMDALTKAGLENSDLYTQLSKKADTYKDVVEAQSKAQADLNDSEARNLVYQSGIIEKTPTTQAQFDQLSASILKNGKAMKSDDPQGLQKSIQSLLSSLFPQFTTAVNESSNSLDKSSNASSQAAQEYDLMGNAVDSAGNKIQSASDATEDMATTIKNAISSLSSLNNALYKVQNGESLNADEVMSLIEEYPQLISAVRVTADGYTIEQSALKAVVDEKVKDAEIAIDADIKATTEIINDIKARISAYESEMAVLQMVGNIRQQVAQSNYYYLMKLNTSAQQIAQYGSVAAYQGALAAAKAGLGNQNNDYLNQAKAELETQQKRLDSLNSEKDTYGQLLNDVGTQKAETEAATAAQKA